MSCPICGKEAEKRYRPFCSRRCADLDLAKWMSGSYAIPSEDPEDAEESARQSTDRPPAGTLNRGRIGHWTAPRHWPRTPQPEGGALTRARVAQG